jgi:transcriptional regulator with XRE-family HTH domain
MAEWLVRGSVIRQRRRELRLTQQALADRAKVGRRSLQRMENEPGERFQFEALVRVAAALGIPIELTTTDGVRCELLRYSA